ncbi:MAG: flippase-like domain-containing protein [Candidatus Diapherotrites archaeon]|nr:flippase-like domain-containing protein [Candidatus Diapherotrites archaeon]
MESNITKTLLFLLVFGAVLFIITHISEAIDIIYTTNIFFLIVASFFFIVSVIVWLFGWACLIKNTCNVKLVDSLSIGVASFYGSLTPVQIGAEALRSINLKRLYKIDYKTSISASMVAKGIKFFIIALFAIFLFFYYLTTTKPDISLIFYYLSGLFVILLACLLFLLPFNRAIGLSIAQLFNSLSQIRFLGFSKKLGNFFEEYTEYLNQTNIGLILIVFFFCLLSWTFEFLALYFCFLSLNLQIGLSQVLLLATLFAVLERNPLLPRGIGLVEISGYYILAMPSLIGSSFKIKEIVALIVVYDFVRLFLPTALSLFVSYPILKSLNNQKPK